MCVYVHVYMHMCVHVCAHARVCMCVYVYASSVRVCVRVCVCIHTYGVASISRLLKIVGLETYMYVCVHVCMCLHTYMYVRVYTRTYFRSEALHRIDNIYMYV